MVSKCWIFLLFFLLFSFPSSAEERFRIAVIDTGVSVTDEIYPFLCAGPHIDVTGSGTISDAVGHGSVVTRLIIQGLDSTKFCVQIIKWYHSGGGTTKDLAAAVRRASSYRPKIINLSAGGPGSPNRKEASAVASAILEGITVVLSAGNEGLDLTESCSVFPACYPIKNSLFHVVAAYFQGRRTSYTNYGGPVTDEADGRYDATWYGTSFSAARVTNRLAKQYGHGKNSK